MIQWEHEQVYLLHEFLATEQHEHYNFWIESYYTRLSKLEAYQPPEKDNIC